MKLLFLLFPIIASAQYNFTKDQVDHAWNLKEKYRTEAIQWKAAAKEMEANTISANDSIQRLQSTNKHLAIKNELLADSYAAYREQAGKLKETAKRFGIGPYIGYGVMLLDSTIRYGVQIGVSIQYNLIRF